MLLDAARAATLPAWARGHPARRPGLPPRSVLGRGLRRPAAGHADLPARRGQRAGQPQAAAAGVAGGAVRDRHRGRGRADGGAAAGRERAAGDAGRGGCAATPARACGRCAAVAVPGARRTPSTARCCWPRRWTRAATAAAPAVPAPAAPHHGRADARRAARALPRPLRPARRDRAPVLGLGVPVLLLGLALSVAGLVARRAAGAAAPPTGPTRGARRSGRSPRPARRARPRCSSRSRQYDPLAAAPARSTRSAGRTLPLLPLAGVLASALLPAVARAAPPVRAGPRRCRSASSGASEVAA